MSRPFSNTRAISALSRRGGACRRHCPIYNDAAVFAVAGRSCYRASEEMMLETPLAAAFLGY
jgi:hypothetical protein